MKKEVVLINGCSTGLGFDLLKLLDKKKYKLFGLTSKTKKKNNIHYYNPRKEINLSPNLELFLKKNEIDHVIHCSGGGLGYRSSTLEIKKLKELFDINFFSIYQVNKCLIQNKSNKKKLNIIMMGALAGMETVGYLGYSAAKSVLFNYNKNLSKYFKKKNVISKLIVPSFFYSTGGSLDRLKKRKPSVFLKINKKKPLSSKDIIMTINYLLKKDSESLNGSSINLTNMESNGVIF
tara:strand:+ start:1266 stop:1970 length:705 start_codon:yes stop_codon:yes gene_type:complete